ncbi:MAG: LamG-like jellyroll fold domain-containing protein, partial [Patescibacteria group bacterium]
GATYKNLNLNDGLVGYWKLDETSVVRAADASGYGNSGTLVSGPTISSTVAPTNFTNARSVSFDGTDDYVHVGTSFPLFLKTTPITISAWIKPASFSASVGTIVGRWSYLVSPGWVLAVDSTGKLFFIETDSQGNNYFYATGNQTLAANKWYHVVVAYNGNVAASGIQTYVNGVADTMTPTTLGTADPGVLAATNLEIGRRGGTSSAVPFSGNIDDVRIYNRALSPAEIAALAAGNQPSTGLATVTLNSALDVNGDLTLNGGTLDVSSSNYGVTVGGSFLNNGGIFNARKGTVTLDGTASSLQILSGGQQFNALTINANGGTYTLADRLTASGTLTLSNGTLDVSSTGNFTVKAGTITQTSGTFTARSGLVVLTSSSDQTATITSTLNTLRIEDSTENGLVGYWKFDEGTNSGAILDSSGYGNTGTRRGGAGKTWSGSTLPSAITFDNPYAMQFDGTDDYVETNQDSAYDFTSAVSISAWLVRESTGTWQSVVSKSTGASNGYMLLVDNTVSNTVEAWIAAGGRKYQTLASGWNHVVMVYDNSQSGDDKLRLYVNGTEGGTIVGSPTSAITTNNLPLRIGSKSDTAGQYAKGLLDDVRIYNRALSANEV